MCQDFIVKMGVYTDRDQNGDFTITDALFGVEIVGSVILDVKVQFGFEVRYVHPSFLQRAKTNIQGQLLIFFTEKVAFSNTGKYYSVAFI